MKINNFWSVFLVGVLGLFLTASAHGAIVSFQFTFETPFDDSAPAGTTMTVDENGDINGTVNPITITSVDVQAPDYEFNATLGDWEWDGVSYLEATTDVFGGSTSDGGIRIFNPNPDDFPASGAGSDGTGFNEGEYWTIEFDKSVIIEFIDFSSVSANSEIIRVTIGNTTPIDWDQDDLQDGNDGIDDPFDQLVIPAGTDIKFEGVAGDWRLMYIDVTQVPEPSSVALVLLCVGLGFTYLRRRF